MASVEVLVDCLGSVAAWRRRAHVFAGECVVLEICVDSRVEALEVESPFGDKVTVLLPPKATTRKISIR